MTSCGVSEGSHVVWLVLRSDHIWDIVIGLLSAGVSSLMA